MKKLMIATLGLLVGCSQPNEYSDWIEGDTPIERQMEIVKCLEDNGWIDVGITPWESSLKITAKRDPNWKRK